ncbi:unnamed protein product, partial [Oncorhynchus mykiss]
MIIQIHRKQNTETTAASERQKEKTVRRQRECEDLAGEPVPIQLISALKMKTFTEEMRRAMDTELHDPSVCGVCVQQQAALSLNTFIRRKTTQLDNNILEDKLHTHLCNRVQHTFTPLQQGTTHTHLCNRVQYTHTSVTGYNTHTPLQQGTTHTHLCNR